jgi:acyl-coenzyme A thioesterase PaaI-like protein
MDLTFEAISAAEHDRLQALYGPLTQAVRNLIEAGIRTGADEKTIRDAQTAIERVTQTLEGTADDSSASVHHAVDGRPVAWGNPVTGWRNAIAPPLPIHHEADGRWWSEFVLGAAYEGPPGLVHGGICALVLDQILGEAASEGLTKARFTGTITLRYLRGTPLGPLRAEAAIDRTDGFKTFVSGHLSDAEGRTVDAEGIFVEPAWARDAG